MIMEQNKSNEKSNLNVTTRHINLNTVTSKIVSMITSTAVNIDDAVTLCSENELLQNEQQTTEQIIFKQLEELQQAVILLTDVLTSIGGNEEKSVDKFDGN